MQAVEERVQLRQHINDLESRLQMMSVQFAQANAQSAEASRQLNIQVPSLPFVLSCELQQAVLPLFEAAPVFSAPPWVVQLNCRFG